MIDIDLTPGPSRDKDDTKDVKSSRVVSKKPKHRQSAGNDGLAILLSN